MFKIFIQWMQNYQNNIQLKLQLAKKKLHISMEKSVLLVNFQTILISKKINVFNVQKDQLLI